MQCFLLALRACLHKQMGVLVCTDFVRAESVHACTRVLVHTRMGTHKTHLPCREAEGPVHAHLCKPLSLAAPP